MNRSMASCCLLSAMAIVVAAAALQVAGCSQKSASSASAQTGADATAAAQQLKLYQEMLAQHKPKLAVLVGQELIQKYPGTSAAATVQKALPELKARAEHERLAALWLYQTVKTGGLQYTATLDSSQPSGLDNLVQLILRRHAGWPQAVYLYGHGNGFVCKHVCDIVMRVDNKREVWKAHLPNTGDPAMLFNDDRGFIAMLEKAKVIEMDVTTKAHGPETLKFEVGGYDPAKFPHLPKQ